MAAETMQACLGRLTSRAQKPCWAILSRFGMTMASLNIHKAEGLEAATLVWHSY